MRLYHFDTPTPVEAGGADRRGWREDFYAVVIRHVDRPGWVFRFETFGDFAEETLQALNSRTAVAS